MQAERLIDASGETEEFKEFNHKRLKNIKGSRINFIHTEGGVDDQISHYGWHLCPYGRYCVESTGDLPMSFNVYSVTKLNEGLWNEVVSLSPVFF